MLAQKSLSPQKLCVQDMPEEEERRVRFADRDSIYYSMPDLAERELPPIPSGEEENQEQQQEQTDN